MTTTVTPETEAPPTAYWSGPLVVEDTPTGDRRRVMPDALTARDLPQPLMFQQTTPQGGGNPHAGAEWAGRITLLWREGDTYHGAGPLDTGKAGQDLARFMADGPVGVSVDLDDVDSEVFCLQENDLGECVDGEMQITKGRIMGATGCPFPAIPEAAIALITPEEFAALETAHATPTTQALADAAPTAPDGEVAPHVYVDSGDGTCEVCGQTEDAGPHVAEAPAGSAVLFGEMPRHVPAGSRVMGLASNSTAALPPEAWFEDPDLGRLTPITITDPDPETGLRRVYGHAFSWGQPHTALAGRMAPRSASGYAYFRVGALRASCDCPDRDGQVEIPVGALTFGTTHCRDLRADPRAVADHYERTGMVGAYVGMGEDDHGGWVNGMVKPGLSDAQIMELRGATVSGDWVMIGGRLEFVALLAVNYPGFPVPRERFHVSDGRETRLVAAGVIVPEKVSLAVQVETMGQRLAAAERTIGLLTPLALDAVGQRFTVTRQGVTLSGERDEVLAALEGRFATDS